MIPRKKEYPKQTSQKAEELQKQLDELQKEKDDIFAKLQRVAADYDNFQKRSAKQITEGIAHEKERIIKAMLPVLDNFEHALANTNCGESAEVVLKGVRIVYDQMLDALKVQGVEQIEAAGERFNPTMHEAIVQRAEPGEEDGVVLEELQKGYRMNGRVIRASRVVVNKTPAEETAEEPETRDTQ